MHPNWHSKNVSPDIDLVTLEEVSYIFFEVLLHVSATDDRPVEPLWSTNTDLTPIFQLQRLVPRFLYLLRLHVLF